MMALSLVVALSLTTSPVFDDGLIFDKGLAFLVALSLRIGPVFDDGLSYLMTFV